MSLRAVAPSAIATAALATLRRYLIAGDPMARLVVK